MQGRSGRYTMVAIPVIGLAGLLTIGAVPRILQHTELVNHSHEELTKPRTVSVAVAKPSADTDRFSLPGTTQAIQYAPVYARIDGYLKARYADIGTPVKSGQLLAEIDAPELDHQTESAQASVQQAKANLENVRENLAKVQADQRAADAQVHKAKTDLDFANIQYIRYKKLAIEGAVSMADGDAHLSAYNAALALLDSAQQQDRSAAANVKAATAAVQVAQAAESSAQAQYDRYRSLRGFKRVTALFDGVVTKRNVDAGALISGGGSSTNTELFEIANLDTMRIYIYVPEQHIPEVRPGEKVDLAFQEYPGKPFVGTVTNVAGGLDPSSKTLQVEVHIDNKDHKLLPGMYAQAQFETPAAARLAIIPSTAIITKADGEFVYTLDDQNKVHLTPVEIARDLGGAVEISQGVAPGQKVVLVPPFDLADASVVTPVIQTATKKP